MSPEAQLLNALAFAAAKHRNQRRKDAEASPSINDPIALAQLLATAGRVADPVVQQAAVSPALRTTPDAAYAQRP